MWHIYTMASGTEDDGDILKFYFYARDNRTQHNYCLEMHICKSERSLMLAVKAVAEAEASLLGQYIAEFLKINELIE